MSTLAKLAASALCVALLAGCPSTAERAISVGSTEYGFHNAGLVVGRAPGRMGLPFGKGLRVTVRNDTTNAEFDTGSGGTGSSGYTSSDYFVIWLPPGTYSVIGVFAYNGGVKPVDEPFKFVVKPGVMMYIGTIVNSWDMPKPPAEGFGRALESRRYGRLNCPLVLAWQDGWCKDIRPPYAQIVVFDEGSNFEGALRKAVPGIPNVPLQRLMMW